MYNIDNSKTIWAPYSSSNMVSSLSNRQMCVWLLKKIMLRGTNQTTAGTKLAGVTLRPWQTRTHCCEHIVSPVARARNKCSGHKFCVRDTKNETFWNILCPQQMFPSLRSPRNIMDNNVSATMCPHLPGPLRWCFAEDGKEMYQNLKHTCKTVVFCSLNRFVL